MKITRYLLLATGLLAAFASQAFAQAQGVTLNQFRVAESVHDGFAISRPDSHGHMKFGVHLTFDYSNDPLVVEAESGNADSERFALVSDQLDARLSVTLGLADRIVAFAGVPLTLWMEGDAVTGGFNATGADGTGLGDPWLGARVRLLGENDDLFGLGLQTTITFPVANAVDDTQAYIGERGFTFTPELLAELRLGIVRVTANAGVLLRRKAEFGNLTVGNELRWGLGGTVPIIKKRLNAYGEIYSATPLGNVGEDISFGTREGSPMELIFGGKYFDESGFVAGLAAGPGILRGYGSPDFRIIAQVGFEPVDPEPEPGPGDRDGDGLLDPDDQCPDDPEDKDDFEDADGCPDPDNDQDGVLDVDDQCISDPEDQDDFEDEDGCPDPDNDADGLLDVDDQCPNEPEDADKFEDEDGCPDPDNDKDSILDVDDACPTAPGEPSENKEEHGCPKSVRVDTDSGQIVILKRVEFAVNKDRILSRSFPILEEVKSTIVANPQIKKLRVEGHTDDKGNDKYNQDLSKRRAQSVMKWLIENGVDAGRLESYGCGENRPIESNKSYQGRQANRRVEFHILEPAPETARSTEGCVAAD